jgi:outer membrane cobalamin receptor
VPTDTPNHKFFAFLNWQPIAALTIVPSADIEGRRWLQSATNVSVYYRGGDFAVMNLKASYEVLQASRIEVGVTNLSDLNYLIEDGYHAPGRQYFANVRASF